LWPTAGPSLGSTGNWNSCFHAIVWRHFEPTRAREELRTLLRGGRLDGFIPHTIFWHDNAGWRRAPFYATHSLRGNRGTAHIQTPLLALAWELVAARSSDDPGFRPEAPGALRLHYDWLGRHRDPDGDAVFGWMSHYLPGYFWLVERSRRLRYDSRAIMVRYDEHIEDVMVNVVYALSLRALARLTGDDAYRLRAERTEEALVKARAGARLGSGKRPRPSASSAHASSSSSATGSASTTTRSTARDWPPAALAGRHCWSIWSAAVMAPRPRRPRDRSSAACATSFARSGPRSPARRSAG
jgi:hypothetical protein